MSPHPKAPRASRRRGRAAAVNAWGDFVARRSWQLGLAIVLSTAIFSTTSSPAFADQAVVVLSHRAPKACPDRDEMVEQLSLRGVGVRDASEVQVAVDVRGVREPGSSTEAWKGQLTITSPDRPLFSRAVSGEDCQAVTLSLALVAGLALNGDPQVELDPSPAAPPPATEPAPAPPVAAAVVTAVVAEPRAPWLAGVSAHSATGMGSQLALGAGAFVERVWAASQVSVVMTAAALAPPRIFRREGSVDLSAFLGQADLCWYGGLLSARAAVLSLCGGFEVGVIRARGNIERPATAIRPWGAPVVSARGAIQLPERLVLAFAVAGQAPLVRDRFVFQDPDVTVFRSPSFSAAVEIGLARSF
ncbi:MAG TPA: hypothetical protein VGG33_09450 [Polyangia bacterium]